MKKTFYDIPLRYFIVVLIILLVIIGLVQMSKDDVTENNQVDTIEVSDEMASTDIDVDLEDEEFVVESSVLPEEYVLVVNTGAGVLTYDVTANKIIYNSDGSYIVETSLGNELIFKEGMCIIHRYNDLVEIFTDYSFVLKHNIYTVLDRNTVSNEE